MQSTSHCTTACESSEIKHFPHPLPNSWSRSRIGTSDVIFQVLWIRLFLHYSSKLNLPPNRITPLYCCPPFFSPNFSLPSIIYALLPSPPQACRTQGCSGCCDGCTFAEKRDSFVLVNFNGGAEEVHPPFNYFSFEIYFCKKSVLLTNSKSLNSEAVLEPWRFDAFLKLFVQ